MKAKSEKNTTVTSIKDDPETLPGEPSLLQLWFALGWVFLQMVTGERNEFCIGSNKIKKLLEKSLEIKLWQTDFESQNNHYISFLFYFIFTIICTSIIALSFFYFSKFKI